MISFLVRVFSDRYANHGAIGHNLLLLAMYRFAYPFAVCLGLLRLSPNQITTLSLMCSGVAAYALAFAGGGWLFGTSWGMAVLLDFCDGTVARMTGVIRKTAFRYDHSSDLVKIFLVILAAGSCYNTPAIWALSLSASFSFMFFMVINHDLGTARQRLEAAGLRPDGCSQSFSIWQASKAALLTINGHTLLIFFLLPLGEVEAIFSLSYFLTLSALRAARCIHIMVRLPK